jgi:Ni/Co efflux regulator RcnB
MKSPLIAAMLVAMAASASTLAIADEHEGHQEGHQYVHHEEWKKGARMRDEDWKRGAHLDYRERHLREPPQGYEWREVDGNYVLAAIATGVIASVVVASVAAH